MTRQEMHERVQALADALLPEEPLFTEEEEIFLLRLVGCHITGPDTGPRRIAAKVYHKLRDRHLEVQRDLAPFKIWTSQADALYLLPDEE